MAYNLTLNNQQMQLSLARTGGQGTKGDSVSSVTMNSSGDLIVVITDAAGNQVSSTNVGGSAFITATSNLYDQFDDRYLGQKSSAPSVDNDGNALLTGAIYFDTTSNTFAFWNGSTWKYPVTEATTAKTAAETAKTAAETAETNAETAETNAAASATTASTQATNAANSAAASLTSANNSATSATASAGSATAAASSASTASTQATNSATSATNAATSETNSANSATAANTSATNAANSATAANTSATNAASSATNAGNSATTATSQATTATNAQNAASSSASAAATSETNAAASQSSAGSSATAASTSATNAATSASNAAASLASVETLYDNFDDRFLGNKSSDPATDNDGNSLVVGTFYYNTTTNELKVYSGSGWVAPSTSASNSASAAATSATSASNSATAASASETAAATSATNAANSATAAATSATNASNSASAASTSATNAATSETNAGNSANAAATSATNAATSETNAGNSATAAATSATNSANSATASDTAKTAAQAAQTAAETAETNAETAETNAGNSANAAATSATSAGNSATAAASSASAASTSETNAATSSTNASTSETNAGNSATAAATSATAAQTAQAATELVFDNFDDKFLGTKSSDPSVDNDGNALVEGAMYYNSTSNAIKFYNGSSWEAPSVAASNSATAAATSATNASNSASAASTSATNAANSATSAATSETNAATSATNSSNSASTATTQASNAASSATNASNSATAAATSETNSSNSASAAATSASNAATSETNAATSATNASNSATAAATSATNASNSASGAATSATNAANSATAAQTAQTAAETALDSFDDRYLGVKASDPTVDNDGNALVTGALYFNSGGGSLKVYDGTQWNPTAATTEAIQDVVGALLVAGNGIDLNYDDAANSLTITSEGSEQTATNNSGSTIAKGTPVYQSGTSGQTIEITPAQAGSSSTMPAIGIVTADIANGTTGVVSIGGRITNLDTSAYSDGDTLYIGSSGSLVNSPPTGENNLIQNIAKVVKTNASSGSIIVTGAGRSNATPNLNNGNFFLGNGSNQSVATDFDTAVEANSKVAGIESGATADQTGAEIKALYEAEANAFTDAQFIKLSNIEASADVTDTTNVTAAGALMDSEVTNLAQVKAFDSSDYATAAQGTNADAALPKAGGTMTGNIVFSSTQTVDGRDISADGSKLDGIESNATADQTSSEILTSIKTVDGATSGLDSDLLDGQHGSYYTGYTDTAISNLVDSSPAALNTLNELAAALGDDANFSTTVTNSLATKLPLAGGTMTGTINMNGGIVKSSGNTVTASSSSTTINMTSSNFHVINMQADTTFTLSNLANAVTSSGTIVIKQDATGGRDFTLPSSCKTPVGGATITQYTGANSTSVLSYLVVSSTEVLVNYIGNFA